MENGDECVEIYPVHVQRKWTSMIQLTNEYLDYPTNTHNIIIMTECETYNVRTKCMKYKHHEINNQKCDL